MGRNEVSRTGTDRRRGRLRIRHLRLDKMERRSKCNPSPARTARTALAHRTSERLEGTCRRRDTCRRNDPALRKFDQKDNPMTLRIECTDEERSRNAEDPARSHYRSRRRRRYARRCRSEGTRACSPYLRSSRASSLPRARPHASHRRTGWTHCIPPRPARTARDGSAALSRHAARREEGAPSPLHGGTAEEVWTAVRMARSALGVRGKSM